MWPLLYPNGLFFFLSLGSLLGVLDVILLDLHFSHWHVLRSHPWILGNSFAILNYGCMVLLWCYVVALTRRARVRFWAWQRVMRFVDDYGLDSLFAKRYGWFGAVGTVVGVFCGIALEIVLVELPYVLNISHRPYPVSEPQDGSHVHHT